jgi:hypothetical protein
LFGKLLDEPELPVTGVVHDDVEPAEVIVGPFDRSEVAVTIVDVQPNRQQRVAVFLGQVVQRCRIACRGGDLVATL